LKKQVENTLGTHWEQQKSKKFNTHPTSPEKGKKNKIVFCGGACCNFSFG
jgi:hypothetical protein